MIFNKGAVFMIRNLRIAIASTDGKVINEHFGRAKEFLIVDIKSDGSYEFIERRAVAKLCSGGEHTQQALAASIDALYDCNAVLVSRIGTMAKRALELNKIPVFEQPDYIEDAIEKIAKYFVRTNYFSSEER